MAAIMFDPWLVAASTPLLAAALTGALIGPARRIGLVDTPGGRKQHAEATPLVGGLAIFLTLVIAALLLGTVPGGSWSFFAALLVTVALGVADDAHDVGHRLKFAAQLLAALLIVSGTTVHVTHLGDILGSGPIRLGKWSTLVTAVAIVGLMNAINMIDGVDGLAGKLSFLAMLVMSVVAFGAGRHLLGMEILIAAGAIAGFLYFNLRTPWRHKATAFMGDTGGMLLGLLLAWYAAQMVGGASAPVAPITAVWILAVPLLDMGSVMLLRLFQRRSPFCADRQHLHYILLDGGYACGQVVAIMSGFAIVFAVGALQAQAMGVSEQALFAAFLCVWAIYLAMLLRPDRFRSLAYRLIRPLGSASA